MKGWRYPLYYLFLVNVPAGLTWELHSDDKIPTNYDTPIVMLNVAGLWGSCQLVNAISH